MKLKRKKLLPQNLLEEETLFHVANGYLGVRGNFEEGYSSNIPTIRGCYVNGFYDIVTLSYPEKLYGFPEKIQRMVNLPDIQTMKLQIGDEPFDIFTGQLEEYERELDTQTGVTRRHVVWVSPKGQTVIADIFRMASFTCPNLFLTVYEVSLPKGGEARLTSEVNCSVSNYVNPADPRVASEQQQHIFFDDAQLLEDGGLARCHTGASDLKLAVCQRLTANASVKTESEITPTGFETKIWKTLMPGEKLQINKYTLISDSRHHSDPAEHTLLLARQCIEKGSDILLKEQREYMTSFWRTSAIHIDGDERINQEMEYNLYMLLQSAGRDSISNVAAKGLSGEGYEGHYFWDTEIYIFPFFALTHPEHAKKLLDFRYSILDKAREHARIMGHTRGALYPWRTISGSECSSYFPSGSAQYHITADVAYSLMQYYYLTGDLEYMAQRGCEILLETARLWLQVGHYDRQERFCIYDVTGPDEYTCIVNNNYYTNLLARHNLLAAVSVYDDLKKENMHITLSKKIQFDESELEAFSKAAQAMYLPYDETLNINAQDDSFLDKPIWDFEAAPSDKYPLLLHYHPLALYRHQVCKQADTVLGHFLFEDDTDIETIRNSYLYYERITTHDSSLSACVFSIMAARLGDLEKAYNYYVDTVRSDLYNAHGNTKDGIHTANMGGAYLGLVAGFAGLRVKSDGLHFRFALPAQWQGYTFSLWYRKSLLQITVQRSFARISLEEGPPVFVTVNGQQKEIDGAVTLKESVFLGSPEI